ncbi:class I SAM-dependent methyltransferase [Lichenibacterium dinghuense]|uniref:class I SAM-dependent methyltransferase n=1 Tax=Lichenibacterium dinghuense TaxID=2895977 RepID=UPI001F2B55AF|nr:class I SAM-dependent methyltransferase [Lichenibacterium sp. 6Y81]
MPSQDRPLFADVVFGPVLSLGANCEPAHHLRIQGRHQPGLFDWLVTPLDAIEHVLADDGAKLGSAFIAVQEGRSVRCGAYDLLFHHEFPRRDGDLVMFDAAAVEACGSKLAHKWHRFIQACEGGEPVLFVRFSALTGLPWDRIDPARDPLGIGDLNRLAAALGRRFPGLVFRLLVVLPEPDGGSASPLEGAPQPLDARVAVERMPAKAGGAWSTSDGDWRALLARLRFRSPGRATALGEALHWSGEDAAAPKSPYVSARPGLASEIAAEVLEGRFDAALHHLDLAVAFGAESPEAAVELGQDLWRGFRSHQATVAFGAAFAAGRREPEFLRDHLGLLSGETRYGEVLTTAATLTTADAALRRDILAFTGHARLALAHDRTAEIEAAERREASPRWLDTAAVMARIEAHLAERRPFSLIRLGDGEARFLIAARRGLCPDISDAEAGAIGSVVWHNWFGRDWADADPAAVADLATSYEEAVAQADIVGASDSTRLRQDTGHYGYLAAQERWLRGIGTSRPSLAWTSAFVHQDLDRAAPFLASLLQGRRTVGLISPHPRLAERLRRRFGIGTVVSHVIPGEGRLPGTIRGPNAVGHFPDLYGRLLATIEVPEPGCLFLVAGGLLGKIYCARIKALGGVAIDVGALVDAWMGYNTRSGQLAGVGTLEVPPAAAAEGSSHLAAGQAEHDRLQRELATLKQRLDEGFAVDFNDFAYRPRERDWSEASGAGAIARRLEADEERYARLLEQICSFAARFRAIPSFPAPDKPHWENWWLPGLDAAVLYGLVAIRAPRVYMEIGSGFSTKFVRQAIIDNGLPTRIVSIDPHPTADVDAICDRVIRERCEDVSPQVFSGLDERDMLFVDNSHRSFQNSDVTVFFTEILPSLAHGVTYGLHDIFVPFDYPQGWTNRFYNEQYLMMAYLLGGADDDDIVFPTHHVSREQAFAPLRDRLPAEVRHLDGLASSFWMRRRTDGRTPR